MRENLMGIRPKNYHFFYILVFLLTFCLPTANAQITVFDTFGPSDSDAGYGQGVSNSQTLAYQFVPTASGNVSDIWIAASQYTGANAIEVALMTDSSNSPGTVLKTWTFYDKLSSSGSTVLHGTGGIVAVISEGEAYWLAATVPSGYTTSTGWQANVYDSLVGRMAYKSSTGFDGPWNSSTGQILGAFRVAVSEPEVIYNNFGESDSYSTSSARRIVNTDTEKWTVATSFKPSVSSYVSDIWAALIHRSGDNVVAVALMTDSGGAPGSVLERWDFVDEMPVSTYDSSPVHKAGNGTTEISAGTTYWIAATIPDGATGELYWYTNNIGVYGYTRDKESNGFTGEWNSKVYSAQPAFRISGYIIDNCPDDPDKTEPGVCGCGVADTDSDDDGYEDCIDGCPDDPDKSEPGVCGCGYPDDDSDGDGTMDCDDNCMYDRNKTEPGVCGCGVADTDSDGDGYEDCIDNCPFVYNPDQADGNNNGIGDACENLPDLTGSWSSLKFNSKNGTCSGRLSVENAGTLDASAFSVAFYLSDNGTDTVGDPIAVDTIRGVRIGRSSNASFRYKCDISLTGKYVIAIIDSGNEIFEKNEDNNSVSQLIQ
jgi:hypothetical protein